VKTAEPPQKNFSREKFSQAVRLSSAEASLDFSGADFELFTNDFIFI
jgi:hypothetical protein